MKEIIKIQVLSLSLWGFSSGSLAAEDKDFVAAMTKLETSPDFYRQRIFRLPALKAEVDRETCPAPRA